MNVLAMCIGGRLLAVKVVTNGPILRIPLKDLRPGRWQPRRLFDEDSLAELAVSIEARGVLTPLRVIQASDESVYLIVAGERRWRAACLAGLIELPCLLLNRDTDERLLRELAVLDNLHRANLRPGEEARAIVELDRLGMTQREIGQQLGKSPTWVSQRLMLAKLPDRALEQLDAGVITSTDALALSKLLDYPDLLDACLDPDGNRLKAQLAGHVPDNVGERVRAARRVLEIHRQRESWAVKMRADGHRVLEAIPREGDRMYVRLLPSSDTARAHHKARLSCEAWGWEHGRPLRYCDNPALLQRAMVDAGETDPIERARQEEHRKTLEREAARDGIVRAWLATSRGLEAWELAMLARERIRTLTAADDQLLAQLGSWLGVAGDRPARATAAERELADASERRLIQLWFLVEVAQTVSYSVVPLWLAPWLEKLGFVDSRRSPPSATGGTLPRTLEGLHHMSEAL